MSTPALFRPHRTPLPPSPITLLSLAEMVERIEAIRLEAAEPTCLMCGSTADLGELAPKWCPGCQRSEVRKAFSRNRTRGDGRNSTCRQCDAKRRTRRLQRAASRFRRLA
jgi:hypothetical protein